MVHWSIDTNESRRSTLTKQVAVSVLFRDTRQTGLLYGRNLNAPAGGARPDPAFANRTPQTGAIASRSR